MAILKFPRFIPLGVRLVVLRIIVTSSLSSFLLAVVYGGLAVGSGTPDDGPQVIGSAIIPLSVLLHHILRLWPRKKWLVILDLIYSTAEFVAVILCMKIDIPTDTFHTPIPILALTILFLSVFASLIFTIWNLRASQCRTLWCTYEFMEHDASSTGGPPGRWSLLFGGSIFKRRFGMDRAFIRGLRAVIAILCLLVMITLGYLVLIVQPTAHELYFQTLQAKSPEILQNVTLTVAVALDNDINDTPFSEGPPLDSVDLSITWLPDSQEAPCGTEWPARVQCTVHSPFCGFSPDGLIITINYSFALQLFPTSRLRTGVYLNIDPNEGTDMVENTNALPIQLYPGFHLFGTTYYSYRDTYANSRDLLFGISSFNRHLVVNVQALIPDPEYIPSNADNTTATLRLTYRGGSRAVQSNYDVRREQSSNTVLSGFALLGGVWTFINGLFATVFGCTLLLVLFGIKPLSIYGLVHLFQCQRSLVDGGYTLSVEEQTRTIAVLREHLLDDDGDMDTSKTSEDTDHREQPKRMEDVV